MNEPTGSEIRLFWVPNLRNAKAPTAEEIGAGIELTTMVGRYATPQPAEDGRCSNCERCRWDPERDCGKAEHPHCDHCGHCLGRHSGHALPDDDDGSSTLMR